MSSNRDPIFWLNVGRDFVAFSVTAGTGVLVWHRKRSAHHWPMTHGKVEYAMTSDDGGWKTNLSYSYIADGEFYSGVHPIKARSERVADEHARKWKGQPLTVRYSPKDPAISVVRMEDQAPLLG